MLYAIHCMDGGDPSIRQSHYPRHREYLASACIKILIAGPILSDEGEPIGRLLIVDAENIESARRFSAKDPFAINGAWTSIQIFPYRMAIDGR